MLKEEVQQRQGKYHYTAADVQRWIEATADYNNGAAWFGKPDTSDAAVAGDAVRLPVSAESHE